MESIELQALRRISQIVTKWSKTHECDATWEMCEIETIAEAAIHQAMQKIEIIPDTISPKNKV